MAAPSDRLVPHPLDADIALMARMVARGLYLPVVRVGSGAGLPRPEGAGRGWHHCVDLLQDRRRLDDWLDAVAADLARTHRRPPPAQVPATYVMGWYLDAVARVGATWSGLVRRVPDLSPQSLSLHLSRGGWPDGVALSGTRFACLPDDPAVTHPDAQVVDDLPALAATLRERVTGHAESFHAAFRPGVKIGSRQRWGMVDDVLEAAAWAAGTLRGDPGAGVVDAEALVGANPSRRRRTCCFAYRLDDSLVCSRCPRLP